MSSISFSQTKKDSDKLKEEIVKQTKALSLKENELNKTTNFLTELKNSDPTNSLIEQKANEIEKLKADILKIKFNLYEAKFGQEKVENTNNNKFLDDETSLYLETNINFATSTEDSRPDAQAGTGTLGIKFNRKFIYGKVRFTVFSRNDEIEAESNTDNKIFGSNLLIPQNSSSSISNFIFLLGTKSFYKYENVSDNEKLFTWKRFGGYVQFAIYNTEWVNESLTLPITTTVLDLHLTYRLLSLDVQGENNGRADLYLLAGYSNRRLGGDYGLDSNSDLRNDFIGTEERGYDAYNIGARLEISNFFGQVNLTNFGNDNISGFSGDQAVIALGFNANLNLKAKGSKSK